MQILPILLIAIVLIADAGLRLHEPDPPLSLAEAALVVGSMIGGVLVVMWAVIWRCRRRTEREGRARAIVTAERAARYARWGILLIHALSVLALGWLDAVRAAIGNLVLIDEFVAILPAVLGVIGTWWVFYPIERRLREAVLIRRLDRGQPIHPMPTRRRYLWEQTRMGMLLLLVPLLLIVGLAEAIRQAADGMELSAAAQQAMEFATLIAALCVFLIAPLLARVMLSVTPLPDGPVRHALLDICRHHGVRVRELLLWRTSGSMINAAVMGLHGRLRYVLITDALLESMTLDQVKAVMAHEVGHVRKHHMPWMVIALIAVLILTAGLIELPLIGLHLAGLISADVLGAWGTTGLLVAQLAGALLIFGWVSRRFERQADAFAVEHLSSMPLDSAETVETATSRTPQHNAPEWDDAAATGGQVARSDAARAKDHEAVADRDTPTERENDRIHPNAVATMCSALQAVSELNAVDPERPSWRHGSIAWRQAYLRSIVGQPIGMIAIHRIIRRIKAASAATVLSGIMAWVAMTVM